MYSVERPASEANSSKYGKTLPQEVIRPGNLGRGILRWIFTTILAFTAFALPAQSQQQCPVTKVQLQKEVKLALYGFVDAVGQFVVVQGEDVTKGGGGQPICPLTIGPSPCKPGCGIWMGGTQICKC